MIFRNAEKTLFETHLYAGKRSPARRELRGHVVPALERYAEQFNLGDALSGDKLLQGMEDVLGAFYLDHHQDSWFREYVKQIPYMVIGYTYAAVLEKSKNSDESKDELVLRATDILMQHTDHYYVAHEFATLAWYDKILPGTVVFDRITDFSVDERHLYHILSELSLTFPEDLVNFLQAEYSENTSLVLKVYRKMVKDRERTRELGKEISPSGSVEYVRKLFTNSFPEMTELG